MEQPEGIHLVSGRTEGHTSSQVLESMGMQKKQVGCFACNETSHSLDQCSIKYKLVTVARQFGYATKFPFSMIQPSEAMLEKEKFSNHCVVITSDVSNLDLGILKGELQKLWNLSGDWVLKRECTKSFLASFSSQGDVVSCLKKPYMETLLNDKEVKLTVTKLTEDDDESNNGLTKQWFLVSGVPRKYRAWRELYQIASAFGVLIDVDEGSLEVGDKEPIRLKIALRNHDSAPFSYHYVVGWSSRLVVLTVEAKIDSENSSHNTGMVTSTGNHVFSLGDFSNKEHGEKELNNATKSILLEGPTSTGESSLDGKTKENKISTPAPTVNNSKKTTIPTKSILLEGPTSTGESNLDGKTKENKISTPAPTVNNSKKTTIQSVPITPYKYVYKRRGKKQEVTEAVNKSLSDELDKRMGPKSSGVTTIGASEMTCKRERNTKEIALMGASSKKPEETGACKEKEDDSVTLATTTINSKERKISEDISETERAQLVAAHTKVIVPGDEQVKPIVTQFYLKVEKEEMKLRKLYSVLRPTTFRKVIVFVNTNDKVKSLTEDVSKHYTVSASHDDMDQHARDTAIKKFQFGSSSVLIATDLRGATNAMKAPVVINYDLPTQSKQYIRRVHQQNDQPGKKSLVINLVTRDDECVFSDIQRLCKGQINELELSDI